MKRVRGDDVRCTDGVDQVLMTFTEDRHNGGGNTLALVLMHTIYMQMRRILLLTIHTSLQQTRCSFRDHGGSNKLSRCHEGH